jgi:uncharacterized protein HemY
MPVEETRGKWRQRLERQLLEAEGKIKGDRNAAGRSQLLRIMEHDERLLWAWTALGWTYWADGQKDDARALWTTLFRLVPAAGYSRMLGESGFVAIGNVAELRAYYATCMGIQPPKLSSDVLQAYPPERTPTVKPLPVFRGPDSTIPSQTALSGRSLVLKKGADGHVLSQSALQKGDWKTARQHLRQWLTENDTLLQYWHLLGWSSWKDNHHTYARRLWRLLRELNSSGSFSQKLALVASRYPADPETVREYHEHCLGIKLAEGSKARQDPPSGRAALKQVFTSKRVRSSQRAAFASHQAEPRCAKPASGDHAVSEDSEVEAPKMPEYRVAKAMPADSQKLASAEKLLAKGVELLDQRHNRQALSALEGAIALKPRLIKAWTALGWAMWVDGRENEARELWKLLARVAPDLPLDASIIAQGYIPEDDRARAVAYYGDCLGLAREGVERQVQQTLLKRAMQGQKITPERLGELLKLHPERNDLRVALGKLLMRQQKYDQANGVWEQVCRLEPLNDSYLAYFAKTQLMSGAREEAVVLAQEALKLNSDETLALEVCVDAAEYSPQSIAAVAPLQRLIELELSEEQKFQLRNRLLGIQVRLWIQTPSPDRLAATLQVLQDLIHQRPHDANAHLTKAEILLSVNRMTESEQELCFVLERLNPQNLRALKGRFEIFVANADFANAEKMLIRIQDFNPQNPYLNYMWARLEIARGNETVALTYLDKLESEGKKGAVGVLLYHGLASDCWSAAMPVERLRDHIETLLRNKFTILTPSELSERLARGENADSAEKLVAITFDDARRDSMELGTPVAKDFGLKFGMAVPTGPIRDHIRFTADWDLLKECAGQWEYGSHLVDAGNYDTDLDANGEKGRPLSHRIWRSQDRRLETPLEYRQRIQTEFAQSQQTLLTKLGPQIGKADFVAYPLGDVGQESSTNVDEAAAINLRAARKCYQMGFIQSQRGYAVKGDDPMLYQRHAVSRHADGNDVVRQLLENHPVNLARQTRTKIAARQGKLYLAQNTIRQLKTDGLPEESTANLEDYLKKNLPRFYLATPRPENPDEAQKPYVCKPYAGTTIKHFQDNLSRRNEFLDLYGGLYLTPALKLQINSGLGQLHFRDDSLTVKEKRYSGTLRYGFRSGAYLEGDLGRHVFSGDASLTETIYGLQGAFSPSLPWEFFARFEHDVVPSARSVADEVTYDSLDLRGVWRASDLCAFWLDFRNYCFSDDNERQHLSFRATRLISSVSGLRLGLRYDYIDAQEKRDDYWSPSRQHRLSLETLLTRRYHRLSYKLSGNLGLGKAGNHLGEDGDEGLQPVLGLRADAKIPLTDWLDLTGGLSYLNAPNYREFGLNAGLQLSF